jgi:mono/diheme cytochrome c family protein
LGILGLSICAPINSLRGLKLHLPAEPWARPPNGTRRTQKIPSKPTDANLQEGMKLYVTYCAQCHGDPATPASALGRAEYPPAPQFISHPADMPENQNFYIIGHGVRLTAMPGWEGVLNQDQIWKVTTFLSHMDKLPSSVEEAWKASPGQLRLAR